VGSTDHFYDLVRGSQRGSQETTYHLLTTIKWQVSAADSSLHILEMEIQWSCHYIALLIMHLQLLLHNRSTRCRHTHVHVGRCYPPRPRVSENSNASNISRSFFSRCFSCSVSVPFLSLVALVLSFISVSPVHAFPKRGLNRIRQLQPPPASPFLAHPVISCRLE
jgi:hypothetical protein